MTASASASSTNLVSVTLPMVTLVAIFAIDSVSEEDSAFYRAFVAGTSVFAIIPALVILLESPIESMFNIKLGSHYAYLLISASGAPLLTIGATVTEVTRGIGEDRELMIVGVAMMIAAVLATALMSLVR